MVLASYAEVVFRKNECTQDAHVSLSVLTLYKKSQVIYSWVSPRLAVIANKPHIYIIKTTNEYVNEQDICANRPALTLHYS